MSSVNGSDGGGGKGGGGGGFVARSAFKLLQLDDRYRFLRPGRVIVDLGAAPGGWSQAIVERARKRTAGNAKRASTPVFALDLLPIVDIEGVTSIQGDFLDGNTQQKLRRMVKEAVHGSKGDQEDRTEDESDEGFVDVVVSDMMGELGSNAFKQTCTQTRMRNGGPLTLNLFTRSDMVYSKHNRKPNHRYRGVSRTLSRSSRKSKLHLAALPPVPCD